MPFFWKLCMCVWGGVGVYWFTSVSSSVIKFPSYMSWIFTFSIQVKHIASNSLTENPDSVCHIFLYLSIFLPMPIFG